VLAGWRVIPSPRGIALLPLDALELVADDAPWDIHHTLEELAAEILSHIERLRACALSS
jgi:hypothetical protein